MNKVFLKAGPVLEKIEAAGFEAYFVGGSVRDFLLEKEIADVDIATSANPEELKSIFSKTLDVGIEHGTVVVLFNGTPYEVTTYRTEAEYLDYRRPSEVQFIRSLEEDLKRRDFTMNAIAMDRKGRLIDPFNGKKDIQLKVIRTVGNPEDRFSEDALRMMRAVRFYSQLSFGIEKNTYRALSLMAHLLEKIAVERKLAEFKKLLAGRNRMMALRIIGETELYKYLPKMSSYRKELSSLPEYKADGLTEEEMWGLLACLFGVDEPNAELFYKSWKLPVKKTRRLLSILKWIHYRSKNEWGANSIYQAGRESALSAERIFNALKHIDINRHADSLLKLYSSLPIKDRSELQLTGNDLMSWYGKPPGPWIKEELEKAESAVLKGDIKNSNESIREWLMKCNWK
ncbi:CCA tRNA nucleotidyltransferase [Cytobacillus sp. NCCP-133]|uniref:CCA tRNA nucleotidyltransferase n=1 Tax=Cytobacillus sp. NCCP-133 TaxID=766848 RepID=UPI00222FD94A|nr:CCA tRNA nucleotidyltransferase [Cytobacillus sp. NCCP-133]GLB57969.1 CCA-adding enzyme [Cytobacillus sp. NCCP-133]